MEISERLRSLHEKSLELTRGTTNENIPVIQRDMEQLFQASSSLLESRGSTVMKDSEARVKANLILSQKGIDTEKLNRSLHSIDLKTSYEPHEPLGDTDIDRYLDHHHEMIIVTAIEEAKNMTIANCESSLLNHFINDWNETKERLLHQMGQRTENYSGPSTGLQTPASRRVDEERKMKGLLDVSAHPTPGFETPFQSARKHQPKTPGSIGFERALGYDHKSAQFAEVVKELSHNKLIPIMAKFCEKTAEGNVMKYCWQLLLREFGEDHSNPPEELHFKIGSEGVESEMKLRFASGSRKYLEELYKIFIERKVQNSRIHSESDDLLAKWLSFKKTESNVLAKIYNEKELNQTPFYLNLPLWPQIFYCLRYGEYENALNIWKGGKDTNTLRRSGDPVLIALQHAVDALVKGTITGTKEILQNQNQLRAMLSNELDPYEYVCLELLSGQDKRKYIDNNIEEFLWQKLCVVGMSASRESVDKVGEMIIKWGEKHFDADGKKPELYFKVLLHILEFERAIDYYARVGSLTDAVHFAIALHHYGRLNCIYSSSGDVKHSYAEPGYLVNASQSPKLDFGRLIWDYVERFATVESRVAVDYICLIRDAATRKKYLTKLLVNTGAFEDLTGKFDSKGAREKGYLHTFLSAPELSEVITSAARITKESGRDDEALELFKRAGDYESAFSILNNQLSQLLDVNKTNEQREVREKWKEIGITMYNQMNVKSGSTLEQLLFLMNYFEKVDKEWMEALTILDKIRVDGNKMIPFQDDNLNVAFNCYKNIDECVKRKYPAVLVSAMKCLLNLFNETKAGINKPHGGTTNKEASLKDFASQGKRLVTFAGLIKMPGGGGEMMRLENLFR